MDVRINNSRLFTEKLRFASTIELLLLDQKHSLPEELPSSHDGINNEDNRTRKVGDAVFLSSHNNALAKSHRRHS